MHADVQGRLAGIERRLLFDHSPASILTLSTPAWLH